MVQKMPQKEENGLELSDREGRFLSMDEILTGKLQYHQRHSFLFSSRYNKDQEKIEMDG